MPREFANRGGFARAVDAGDHDDGGREFANHQRLFQRLEQRGDRFDQRVFDGDGVRHAAVFDAAAYVGEQVFSRLDAGVGHEQGGFQVFVELLVDLAAGEDAGDAGAGLAQAFLQLAEPALALGRDGGGDGFVDVNRRDQRAADERAAGRFGRRRRGGGGWTGRRRSRWSGCVGQGGRVGGRGRQDGA